MKAFLKTWARSFAITFALGLPFAIAYRAALAQDRTLTVREVDVTPSYGVVDVRADGGCVLTGYAVVSAPSIEPRFTRTQYVFNGARCTTVKTAILQAAKNDLGVGDGTAP